MKLWTAFCLHDGPATDPEPVAALSWRALKDKLGDGIWAIDLVDVGRPTVAKLCAIYERVGYADATDREFEVEIKNGWVVNARLVRATVRP